MPRPTLYLIDGYALIYRAYFALIRSPLRTSSGEETSAPFGMANFLVKLLDDRKPDHVGVVLASRWYPESAEKGQAIEGLSEASRFDDVLVFHAGTKRKDDAIVTDGRRVLCVVGRGNDYQAAIARAYEGASRIRFEGMQLRRDIDQKALRASARPDPAR